MRPVFGGYSGEIKFDFIDIAPAPIFPRLERLDDRVLDGVEVFRRVPVFGGIAAPHMTARHAQSQMNPGIADFQAILTSARMRFDRLNLIGVRAFVHISIVYGVQAATGLPAREVGSQKSGVKSQKSGVKSQKETPVC